MAEAPLELTQERRQFCERPEMCGNICLPHLSLRDKHKLFFYYFSSSPEKGGKGDGVPIIVIQQALYAFPCKAVCECCCGEKEEGARRAVTLRAAAAGEQRHRSE